MGPRGGGRMLALGALAQKECVHTHKTSHQPPHLHVHGTQAFDLVVRLCCAQIVPTARHLQFTAHSRKKNGGV